MLEHLHYSPQAQLDLDEIFDHFAVELENSEKGEKVVSGILAAAKKIPGRATRFPPVGPLPFTTDEYRFVQVGNYVIFFRAEGDGVCVDRVLHDRRDFSLLIGGEVKEGMRRVNRQKDGTK